MTTPLSLPEHYVQRTIQNMLPGDIAYPMAEDALRVDDKTLEPRIDKFCPITPKDKTPRRFADRCGIMRIVGSSFGNDGAYLIDIRHLDDYSIEQDTITPDPEDSYSVKEELSEDSKNLVTPLGYIAYDATGNDQLLICSNELVRPELMYLADHTDQLANSALRKVISRLQLNRATTGRIIRRLDSVKLPLFKR